jgi:hypothetical protein
MRSIWAIVVAVALAMAGGIFYLTRPGRTPAGQPPLVEIIAPPAALQAEFNRTSSAVRIILLLSPT